MFPSLELALLCPSCAPRACLAFPVAVVQEGGRQGTNRVRVVMEVPSDEAGARSSSESMQGLSPESDTARGPWGSTVGMGQGQAGAAESRGRDHGNAVAGRRAFSGEAGQGLMEQGQG